MQQRLSHWAGLLTRYSGIKSLLTHVGFCGGDIILMVHRILPNDQVKECFDPHLVLAEAGFVEMLEILGNEYRWVSLIDIATGQSKQKEFLRTGCT